MFWPLRTPRGTGTAVLGAALWFVVWFGVCLVVGAPGAWAQDGDPPPPPPPGGLEPLREDPPPPPDELKPLTTEDEGDEPGAATGMRLHPVDPAFRGALLGDQLSAIDVGDERVISAVGGVSQPIWIRLNGMELRCQRVVIWGDRERLMGTLEARKDTTGADERVLGSVLHAVYAEGDVYMTRDGHVVRASRLFVDFAQNRAYMVDVAISGSMQRSGDGAGVPLNARAAVVRQRADRQYQMEDASFTTCSYHDPHYEFTTTDLQLDFEEEHVKFRTGWWPTVRVDTPFGDKTPIFTLPILGGRTFQTRPLQDVSFGSSSRMGTELEVEWGGDVEREDGSTWGSWTLHTDYRSERGGGVGVDVEYEGRERADGRRDEGELVSYYQRDHADQDDFSERRFDGTLAGTNNENRGRAQLYYRHLADDWLSENTRIDVSGSYYSDRGYLAEYDRKAVRTDPQQDNYIYVRKAPWGAGGNQGLTLLASQRVNDESNYLARSGGDLTTTDFQVQTEYQPSLGYYLINEPLVPHERTGFAPLNLSLDASIASVERRYDDRVADAIHDGGTLGGSIDNRGWRSTSVNRGDVEARFTTPFSLGPVQVTPAFSGSAMGVDEANGFGSSTTLADDDGSEGRTSAFFGVRAGVEGHRRYDVDSRMLDLRGLRHVASFDVHYFDRFAVTEETSQFQQNDLIDDLAEEKIASIRLRNRLQTKRGDEVVDWLDLESRFLHFIEKSPARGPSALGLREDFRQPLQRIDLAGEDKYRLRERDGSTFMQHRMRLQLLENLWLIGEGDYDFDTHMWETSAAGSRWFVTNRLSLYVGRRTIRGDSIIWTARGDYRLSDKWAVAAQQQQSTRANEGLDSRLTLYRRGHDYTFAVEFESERQLRETSLSLAIYPNDWFGSGRDDPFSRRPRLDYDALRWYR